MKKMFLMAMTGLLLASSFAYATGDPKSSKRSTKKICTPACKEKCDKGGCCDKTSCPKQQ
jgi:hypothetical protein